MKSSSSLSPKKMKIAPEVFALFPGYCRGVIVGTGVTNSTSPAGLIALLRKEEEQLQQRLAGADLNEVQRLAVWREAYRLLGVKPTKYRPSIDSLVRRVMQGGEIPLINCLVDIGNLYSLRYLLPVGGHAIDTLFTGMELRPATGDEQFFPFGSEEIEQPEKGEIIFTDGDLVMTRRWTWRQAKHTLSLPSTTAVEFNIDGLPPVNKEEVEQVCIQLAQTAAEFCGGEYRFEVLTPDHAGMVLI